MNVNTGEALQKYGEFWPFSAGEPNGEAVENCAVIDVQKKVWTDRTCESTFLGFCNMPVRPRFKIRGKRKYVL